MSDESHFSRANVSAMFVALALSLLTQPYGSLIYNKPKSTTGKLIFYLWRLNPPACFLEALVILYALSHALIALPPPLYLSPPPEYAPQPPLAADWRTGSVSRRLRLATASLWTLRTYDIWSRQMTLALNGSYATFSFEDMTSCYSFKARLRALLAAGSPLVLESRAPTADANGGQGNASQESPPANRPGDAARSTAAAEWAQDERFRQEYVLALSRELVSDIEAHSGAQGDGPSGWKIPEWSAGAVPVLLYAVKSLASRLPGSIIVLNLFMVADWLLVGLVYLYSRPSEHRDQLLQRILDLSACLAEASTQNQLLALLFLPTAVVMAEAAPGSATAGATVQIAIVFGSAAVLAAVGVREQLQKGIWFLRDGGDTNFGPTTRRVSHAWRRARRSSLLSLFLRGSLLAGCLAGVVGLPAAWIGLESWLSGELANGQSLAVLSYLCWTISLTLAWAPLPSESYRRASQGLSESWQCAGILIGLVGTGVQLAHLMKHYDAQNTHKPWWIEWLP